MNKICIGILITIVVLITFCSCKKEVDKISVVQIEQKLYDFGKISMTDSVFVTFSIKNISEIPFKISNVGTSCGCTTSEYTKNEVLKNQVATIDVMFQPNQIGLTEKSIVVESNTDPPFNVFYLKGKVTE